MKTVTKSSDLVTSKDATISGFSWQAEQKLEKSSAYINDAEHFCSKANNIHSIDDIRKDSRLTSFVIAACMLSQKSLNHLDIDTQNEIIENLIDFEKLQDTDYLRELVNRYCLTSGDSLGGSMRNLVGQTAQIKLTNSIVQRLQTHGVEFQTEVSKSSGKITEIAWEDKRIFFDKTPSFIKKSIDIIVVNGESAKHSSLNDPSDFLCCGELKGGIDPAGADEHWKTAKTALERIHTVFTDAKVEQPKLIFIGTAIEKSMSGEIFKLLEQEWLTGAANTNYDNQVEEIVDIILHISEDE